MISPGFIWIFRNIRKRSSFSSISPGRTFQVEYCASSCLNWGPSTFQIVWQQATRKTRSTFILSVRKMARHQLSPAVCLYWRGLRSRIFVYWMCYSSTNISKWHWRWNRKRNCRRQFLLSFSRWHWRTRSWGWSGMCDVYWSLRVEFLRWWRRVQNRFKIDSLVG